MREGRRALGIVVEQAAANVRVRAGKPDLLDGVVRRYRLVCGDPGLVGEAGAVFVERERLAEVSDVGRAGGERQSSGDQSSDGGDGVLQGDSVSALFGDS